MIEAGHLSQTVGQSPKHLVSYIKRRQTCFISAKGLTQDWGGLNSQYQVFDYLNDFI